MPTIEDAKNIRPGRPASVRLPGKAWAGIKIPVYEMVYDPWDKNRAPACGQTGKAQG